MKTVLSFALALLGLVQASAQCPFNPTVTGNLLLCPETTETLATQQYDAYQWYSRPFSGGASQPIPGATGPTLEVNADDVPFYVSVAATQGGCTEQSPEVLVDGLVFLPVTVSSSGDYDIGPDGELLICTGDTVYLVALLPYTLNIQWYNGLDSIPGANDDTLAVTTPGDYWLTASPGECPNLTEALGVQIAVEYGNTPNCITAAPEPMPELAVLLSPNPAQTNVRITLADPAPAVVTIIDAQGRPLRRHEFQGSLDLYVADLPRGHYVLRFTSPQGQAVRRLVLKGEK